ncbi:MAG: enoyl-CoA hydratase [Cryomorphaceae bacterium]
MRRIPYSQIETSMNIKTEKHGSITIISIERPHRRNAVDWQTAQELYAAFKDFDRDQSYSVAILTGSGGNFCAGADLTAIAEGEQRPILEMSEVGPMGPTRLQLSKPVIAAIDGYAVAGGLELALWCDMRVVSAAAVFGVFCRRFGVPLIDLGTIRLPRLIGQSRATDLILTGRPVNAQEAYHIGLANRVSEQQNALPAALELAEQISAFPQLCMRNDRTSMLEQWGMSEGEACENEIRLGWQTLESGETVAGATKFKAGVGRSGAFD